MTVQPHNKLCTLIVTTIACSVGVADAWALKDPATRDEDISGTEINVDYRERSDGLWVYKYSAHAPESNKGVVTTFAIDLRCSAEFEDVPLPHPDPDREGYEGISNRKPVTPAAIQADWGAAASWGILGNNAASWMLGLHPSESVQHQRLISPAAPGLREYRLKVGWRISEWDYPREPDPDLPSWDDFEVTGMIAAPGCPGEVPPVDKPSFPGTAHPSEREGLNDLLSYSAPLRDRVRIEPGTREVELTIRYREDLDPRSFKVQPGWAKRSFRLSRGRRRPSASRSRETGIGIDFSWKHIRPRKPPAAVTSATSGRLRSMPQKTATSSSFVSRADGDCDSANSEEQANAGLENRSFWALRGCRPGGARERRPAGANRGI